MLIPFILQGVTMSNRKNFSQNFYNLRNSYNLSTTELSYILNLKRNSSIVNIENGKNYPSFELLLDTSNLFAVSVDWLLGREPEPYSEVIIEQLEEKIAVMPINVTHNFIDIAPAIYTNIESRRKYFSLDERANIIFLVQYIQYLIKQKQSLLDRKFILSDIILAHKKAVRLTNYDKKYDYALQDLHIIFFNELRECDGYFCGIEIKFPTKPLFDIRKNL
jgi:transcriptional regulator with XRE-family HTH domain